MNKENNKIGRRFLGMFPPETTFDKKHLKSYLKGYKFFTFGRDKYKQEYYERETVDSK